MPVSGPRENLINLLNDLDPVKLADLARDILTIRKHSNIRVTDGPGDGCRDIHSVSPEGKIHLVQCKFHADTSKTVSSRETGELPLGMFKLGYTQGLFITNACISPQAKREFIDNYPSLALEYLEGTDIVDIVLSDPILRSIWYDGNRIDHVNYVVRIPFLVRNLELGRPIKVSDKGSTVIGDLEIHNEESLIVSIQEGFLSLTDFEPYRPPHVKSMSEGWGPISHCSEFVLRGKVRLDQIARCQEILSTHVIETVARIHSGNHFALRHGKAYLIPLNGESSGAKVILPGSTNTIVSHLETISSESEWLLPSQENDWCPPERITGMTAQYVRWHNSKYDVCLDINVICGPAGYVRGSVEEQHAFYTQSWMKSIFAFFPKVKSLEVCTTVNPRPSDVVDWYDGKILCAWLAWELQPHPFRSMLMEQDDILGYPKEPEPSPWADYNVDVLVNQVLNQISSFGGEIVNPAVARHMFAIAKKQDPIPSKDFAIYRSVDILTNTDLPSPIAPQDRRIMFTCCWHIAKESVEESVIEKLQEYLQSQLTQSSWIELSLDRNTLQGEYIYCTAHFKDRNIMESTNYLADMLLRELSPTLNNLETLIISQYPTAKRATRQYWLNEYSVLFAR